MKVVEWSNLDIRMRMYAAIRQTAEDLAFRPMPPDTIKDELEKLKDSIDHLACQDELLRIKAATLDADNAVCSLTDEGHVISLNDRVNELCK